jgi:hypothetical protein
MTNGLAKSLRDGPLRIGKWEMKAHVLSDGMRVISSTDSLAIFEMTKRSEASLFLKALAKHPILKSLPSSEAAIGFIKPVLFLNALNEIQEGTDAESIVAVCRFILKGREYGLLKSSTEFKLAQAAESVIVSIANVGLVALIDEATGFQQDRETNALQLLLDRYLKKELAVWAKRFPDEFYMQIFRLKGWNWKGMQINRPGIVGTYTRDIVYARLAPKILDELEKLNPSDGHGRRQAKHHQWLSDDIGHPALTQHIYAVLVLMRASTSWQQFNVLLKRSFPRIGDQFALDLGDSDLD